MLSLTSSSFATKANLLNILDQQSATLIIAAAGTLVLIAGGIDLSVGAVYGFAGGGVGALRAAHERRRRDLPRDRRRASLIGLANGLVATVFRINSLIATLAMSFIISGCSSLVTKGNLLVLFDKTGFGELARTEFLTVKTSIWLMVVAVIA